MKRPWEWKLLMPNFLSKLGECSEDERARALRELIGTALAKLSQEEYQEFVESLAVSLASLPGEVRQVILMSSIVNPKGLSHKDTARTREALVGMLRKNIVENSKYRDKIIVAVFDSVLLMDDTDAEEVMSGIVNSSMALEAIDYIKYTAAWMNVLGGMDKNSVKRIIELRKNSIKGFPDNEISKRGALTTAALFMIGSEKRKLLMKIISEKD